MKAANNGRCSYHRAAADVCHAPPLLTDRERRVVEKTIPKTATILRGRRRHDMRGNSGCHQERRLFCHWRWCHGRDQTTLKAKGAHVWYADARRRLVNDSIAETDPNYKAAKLISDMTSAKQVAAPSGGRAAPIFRGTGPAPPLASPSITFAARGSYEGA